MRYFALDIAVQVSKHYESKLLLEATVEVYEKRALNQATWLDIAKPALQPSRPKIQGWRGTFNYRPCHWVWFIQKGIKDDCDHKNWSVSEGGVPGEARAGPLPPPPARRHDSPGRPYSLPIA